MTYLKQTRNLNDLSETLETYRTYLKQTQNLKDISEIL